MNGKYARRLAMSAVIHLNRSPSNCTLEDSVVIVDDYGRADTLGGLFDKCIREGRYRFHDADLDDVRSTFARFGLLPPSMMIDECCRRLRDHVDKKAP